MFKLTPNPTFTADVPMYVPGEEALANIKITFKYQTPDELKAWQNKFADAPILDALLAIIDGWQDVVDADGQPVPYSADNLKALLAKYHTAGQNISRAYLSELFGSRLKN